MRVRDVLSRPVITVRADTGLDPSADSRQIVVRLGAAIPGVRGAAANCLTSDPF